MSAVALTGPLSTPLPTLARGHRLAQLTNNVLVMPYVVNWGSASVHNQTWDPTVKVIDRSSLKYLRRKKEVFLFCLQILVTAPLAFQTRSVLFRGVLPSAVASRALRWQPVADRALT
jgi:hypothetical protein